MSNTNPPEVFILIPGRTSRQGTTLNEGKFTASYVDETSTLMMNSTDMARLGLIIVYETDSSPDMELLERVLRGLTKLRRRKRLL